MIIQSKNPYFLNYYDRVISVAAPHKKGWILWNWHTHRWDDLTNDERDVVKAAEAIFYAQEEMQKPPEKDPDEMATQQAIAFYHHTDKDLQEWAKDKLNGQPYGYTKSVPTLDFNREMHAPGQHADFPDGIVGIRTDDDFFLIAKLPWAFKDLPLQTLVCTLWPDIGANEKYTLGYDTGPGAEYTIFSGIQRIADKMKSLEHQFQYFKEEFKTLYEVAEKLSTPVERERIRKRIEERDYFPTSPK